MELKPQILFARVMHKRLFPKVNAFNYGIYYIALPLSKISCEIENRYFKVNRWGLLSFYNKDHGDRDGKNLNEWAHRALSENGVDAVDGEIVLVTMPRVFGYVFNPVSFWYCYDRSKILRAVICEVNNTFGETHTYVCAHDDQSEIKGEDYLEGQKTFHVSPFMEREGSYKFKFNLPKNKMSAQINFYDSKHKKKLLTALNGDFVGLDVNSCRKAFWLYPLITIKSILLIHWQAVKLFVKGTEYVPKPLQYRDTVTRVRTMKEKE